LSTSEQPDLDQSEFGGLWLTPLGILSIVTRQRRWVCSVVAVVGLLVLVVALRRPVQYTTVVAFIPEGQRAASGVTSIAAQFGVSVAAGNDGLSSPQFYPELVRSPQLLGAMVESTYVVDSTAGTRRNLIEIYDFARFGPVVGRDRAINKLSANITASPAIRTGIVTIAITAPNPALARDLGVQVLREFTRFNQHTRQGRAAAERQFIERRLADVRDSVQAAENRLQQFLMENRDYSTSPTLAFRKARLERDLQAQQLVLNTLVPSYEQSKIEEVRDTPVLTVLRAPEAPVRGNPRGRVRLMALGLIGGLMLGVVLVVGVDFWRGLPATNTVPAKELSDAINELRSSLKRDGFLRGLLGFRRSSLG
jgi:uncharacterized protein involved in exopolysaccharide biosynthesis